MYLIDVIVAKLYRFIALFGNVPLVPDIYVESVKNIYGIFIDIYDID